jgi:regulatory protein
VRALARLARRDHSEHELRRVLVRDGYAPEVIDDTIARLKRERYLDDAGFAARLARSRLTHSGVGRHRVRQELRRKGVKRTVVEAGLRDALVEVSEAPAIDALARRYWKSRDKDDPGQRVRKLWALLLRRGFPADLVSARLRALWPRWSDALDGLEPAEE